MYADVLGGSYMAGQRKWEHRQLQSIASFGLASLFDIWCTAHTNTEAIDTTL